MKNFLLFFTLWMTASTTLAQESLKIIWIEKYEWELLSSQEDEKMHVLEVIPGGQTAENWTMLGQMVSIKGVNDLPLDSAQHMMFQQAKSNSPNPALTFLEKDEKDQYPWILFKLENVGPNEKEPESQLWYIRQGKTSLFISFIAVKEPELKTKFIKDWSSAFKASKMVWLEDGVEIE